MKVTHCTNNAGLFFEAPPVYLLGQGHNYIFPSDISHRINNCLGSSLLKRQRMPLMEWKVKGEEFFLSLSRTDDFIAIEIEPIVSDEPSLGHWIRELELVRRTLSQMDNSQKIIDWAVIGLRRVLGFERVMFYRNHENTSYEFMSEAFGPYLPSGRELPHSQETFLRFRDFKAPRACVDLGKRNTQLLALKADKAASKIINEYGRLSINTALSQCSSFIDTQNLLDDNVASFITFPLIMDDIIWGVFEGHHIRPQQVGRHMRDALNLFSEQLSFQLSFIYRQAKIKDFEDKIKGVQGALNQSELSHKALSDQIRTILDKPQDSKER